MEFGNQPNVRWEFGAKPRKAWVRWLVMRPLGYTLISNQHSGNVTL